MKELIKELDQILSKLDYTGEQGEIISDARRKLVEIERAANLMSKEAEKKVRHKACDIVLEVCSQSDNDPNYTLPSHLVNSINHNIMNIQP